MSLSRRAVLGGLAGLGGLMVGGGLNLANAADAKQAVKPATPAETKRFAQVGGDFSWKPQKMDLKQVAEVGHAGFHYKGYG